MDTEIRTALHSLEQAIRGARGPIFSDADYGRVLRAFLAVCHAMDHSDRCFRAKAAEAERIERERERERNSRSLLDDLDEELGIWGEESDG
jgi:hypothetical protein